jgi:hypothetical protein
VPEHSPVTCVKLPGQETGLARGKMVNTSGGCILPGCDPLEHIEDIIEIIDDIYDLASEWWG